jgi:hypothetical protein
MGSDPQRFPGGAICENGPVRAKPIEEHVCRAVTDLLLDPNRIFDEWSWRQTRQGAPQN